MRARQTSLFACLFINIWTKLYVCAYVLCGKSNRTGFLGSSIQQREWQARRKGRERERTVHSLHMNYAKAIILIAILPSSSSSSSLKDRSNSGIFTSHICVSIANAFTFCAPFICVHTQTHAQRIYALNKAENKFFGGIPEWSIIIIAILLLLSSLFASTETAFSHHLCVPERTQ